MKFVAGKQLKMWTSEQQEWSATDDFAYRKKQKKSTNN